MDLSVSLDAHGKKSNVIAREYGSAFNDVATCEPSLRGASKAIA